MPSVFGLAVTFGRLVFAAEYGMFALFVGQHLLAYRIS